MAILSTATTNFNKTVQELINKRLEELLRAPLPYIVPGNFIKATHVKGSNGTMRFLNVPDITVDDTELAASLVQAEGVPNTSAALTLGYEEFTTRQRMKTISFTDVALLESPLELAAVGADRLARYVMVLLHAVARAVIAAGANAIYSGTGNTATNQVAPGDVLDAEDVKRAVAILEGSSVPRFGDDAYRGVLHPYVKFDFELDDEVGGWIDASRYAGSTQLFTGEIGKFAGVRFVVTSEAAVKAGDGESGNDVYVTTINGPDFFALGDFGNNETFVTPPGGHDDPGHQSMLMTWKGWADAMLVGEGTNATNVSDPRYINIESASSL